MRTAHFIVALLLYALAQAQPFKDTEREISFVHYTVSDGLPDNQVNCLLQDEDGFIWMGTNSGLCRFDGHYIEVFTRSSTRGHLPGNIITALLSHPDGGFWIGTADGGPCRFHHHTFTPVKLRPAGCTSMHVNAVFHDHKNERVFFGMNHGGIFSTDENGNAPQKLEMPQYNAVYAFLETELGFYFSQPGQSVQEYSNGKIISSKQDFVFPSPTHTASCFFRDSRGMVWFGSWSENFYRLDAFNARYTPFPLYPNRTEYDERNEVTCIGEDATGKLWLGSKQDGLLIYDPVKDEMQHVVSKRTNPFSLRGNRIRAIIRDKNNRMWIAGDGGISISDPHLPAFRVTWISRENDNHVHSFVELNGAVWAGTDQGLVHTTTLEKKLQNQGKITLLHKLSDGQLLVGSDRTLIHCDTLHLEPLRWKVRPIDRIDFENLASSRYTSATELVFRGKRGILAAAYGHGAVMIHSDSLSFVEATVDEIPENLIRRFITGPDSTLWVAGASQGLLRLQPERAHNTVSGVPFQQYAAIPCEPVSAPWGIREVFDFLPSKDGGYLSTHGHGIQQLRNQNGEMTFKELPVPLTSPFGIESDRSGQLWIISSTGIARYQPEHQQFQLFGKESGIPTEGLQGDFFKDSNGELYCGGNGFLIRFNPEQIRAAGLAPACRFISMEVNGVRADSLLSEGVATLSPDQNALVFRCTSLLYTNPQHVNFYYQLNGVSADWVDNGNNPLIRVAGLAPGNYQLNVKTRSGDNQWSPEIAAFSFEIRPRFYQTWWFYALLLLGLAGSLLLFYQYRVRQLKAFELMRNKIARDLHDDIGSALGSISYLGTAAERNLGQGQVNQAAKAISRIGETSRQTIDTMHDIVWAVNTTDEDGNELITKIRDYGSDICAAHEISFLSEITGNPASYTFSMTERKNIYLIAKEAIYNAVKYAGAQTITLTATTQSGRPFAMSIHDNGKGFDPAQKYNGMGLKSMRLRAEEIGGSLNIESSAEGTRITFHLKR
ncbi:MAG: two-component regulator propeller domain-containing protein [Flavobacteriales bacterium]